MGRPPLERVEELFHRAADLDTGERAALLETECGTDINLRAAVEELLQHDDPRDRTDGFIVRPVERRRGEPADSSRADEEAGGPLPRPGPPGYELLELLGQGGMGVVFKARQLSLNRLVALKILRSSTPVRSEQLARFQAEAEALARVQHPNIVQIHEVGEYEGRPFLVMEYIAGPTLAHDLQGRPQAPGRAAELLGILAGAVQAVHDCGIIHRDLKPANVLLAHRTLESPGPGSKRQPEAAESEALVRFTPKITDFGLARRLGADSSQTTGGLIWGTPSYMAPEQVSGPAEHLGPATDIYALGAILYEVLTGRPPFGGASTEEVLARVLMEEPLSPAQLRPALPRDLVTICLKCLEKEPGKRYASAAQLAEDLQRFLAGKPITARPLGLPGRLWRWCRRRPLVAALTVTSSLLAVALVITVIAYESLLLKQTEQKLQTTEQEAAEKGKVAEEERRQLSGEDRILGAREEERGEVFAALLWLTEALRLDAGRPEEEQRDREAIAHALQHCPDLLGLRVHDQRVVGGGETARGCWLASVEEDSTLAVREVLTGQVRKLHGAIESGQAAGQSLTVAISPDGRLAAVTGGEGADAQATRVWDLQTDKPRTRPLHHRAPVVTLTFSDDNNLLVAHLADHADELWDLRTGQQIPLEDKAHGRVREARASAEGGWMFTLWADGVAGMKQLADGKPSEAAKTVGKTNHTVALGAWRPDGRQLAVVDTDNVFWIWDISTGKERRLDPTRSSAGKVTQVKWSPDVRLLLTVNHLHEVRVWDATGEEPVTPVLPHPGGLRWAGFAGSDKVVTVDGQGSVRVWRLGEGNKSIGPENRPVAELHSLAELLAGRRVGADGTLAPMTKDELEAAWKKLHGVEGE
jgi:serine/threonine protein kinase